MRPSLSALLSLCLIPAAIAQTNPKRLVLIDQDGSGPGGSNQMAMMLLLQASQVPAFNVEVLGITIVTGNAWRDEETQHTLRMLELIHRTDIPVAQGAVFPLVRTQQETLLQAPLIGNVSWLGAWGGGPTTLVERPRASAPSASESPSTSAMPARPASSVIYQSTHGPNEIPIMPEGAPTTKPIAEDAVHFLIRQVHAHPHQVTLYAAGPLTNIALAVALDPTFADTTAGLVVMGGSLNPQTDDPEFAESPRHEFNFWFDPEAAHIVLRAHWPRNPGIGIVLTPVDISIKARFTQPMLDAISKAAQPDPARHPAAQYIANWSQERYYMWDEIAAAAWLDPSIITRQKQVLMDVDLSHGPSYGNTLTWTNQLRPATDLQSVQTQQDLNLHKFGKLFTDLMSVPAQK